MINIAIKCFRNKDFWIVIEQDGDDLHFIDDNLTLIYTKKQIRDVIEGRAEMNNFWMCSGELHINLGETFFVAEKYVTLLLDYMLQETT